MTEQELAQLSKLNTKRENKLCMTERECQEFVELIIKMQTEEIERLRNDLIRATTTLVYAGFKDTGEYLWQAAKAMPSVPQWIPVSERLPDSDDEVLVYPFPDNSYGIRLGTYHPYEGKLKGKWTYEEERHSYYEQVEINNVTHWMPLPAAPVKDGA